MSRKKLPTDNVSRGEPQPPQTKRRTERTITVLDFAAAVQQFVTQSDMAAICAALTESARSGNVVAARLLIDYMVGAPGSPDGAARGGEGHGREGPRPRQPARPLEGHAGALAALPSLRVRPPHRARRRGAGAAQ